MARQLQGKLAEAGAQLAVKRRAAAGKLRAAVESCLADLAMAGSRFDVRICWQAATQVCSNDGSAQHSTEQHCRVQHSIEQHRTSLHVTSHPSTAGHSTAQHSTVLHC